MHFFADSRIVVMDAVTNALVAFEKTGVDDTNACSHRVLHSERMVLSHHLNLMHLSHVFLCAQTTSESAAEKQSHLFLLT